MAHTDRSWMSLLVCRAGRLTPAITLLVVAGALAGLAFASPWVYVPAASREASRIIRLVRLPPGAQPSANEPAGAGSQLADPYCGPFAGHVAYVHEFFVVPGTPGSVLKWVNMHRPSGSRRGFDWSEWCVGMVPSTAFSFGPVDRILLLRILMVDAVPIDPGHVAVRVDAEVAPRPKPPVSGRGPGTIRIVETLGLGGSGSFGFELHCLPSRGTVPYPERICAAIREDPLLLYDFPGGDHSCPSGTPSVLLGGRWQGKSVDAYFGDCSSEEPYETTRWWELLPSFRTLDTIHVDRGIGLVSLDEREAPVLDLLRSTNKRPALCRNCTRTFNTEGPFGGAWRIRFTSERVSEIVSYGVAFSIAGVPSRAWKSLTHLRHALRDWTEQRCGKARELVHSSPTGSTAIVTGSEFQEVVVAHDQSSCSVRRGQG